MNGLHEHNLAHSPPSSASPPPDFSRAAFSSLVHAARLAPDSKLQPRSPVSVALVWEAWEERVPEDVFDAAFAVLSLQIDPQHVRVPLPRFLRRGNHAPIHPLQKHSQFGVSSLAISSAAVGM